MAIIRARDPEEADVEPAEQEYVFTVTDGGYAKRSLVSEYRLQGRGGLGIKAMKLNDDRGVLVGGLVVVESDEVMAIRESGQITRSAVAEVPVKSRDTMGVKFVQVKGDDKVLTIAINPESDEDEESTMVENGTPVEEHSSDSENASRNLSAPDSTNSNSDPQTDSETTND
jgi:DNA gyrase subunit A